MELPENPDSPAATTGVLILKSCLRTPPVTKFADRPRNRFYSTAPEEFGPEREARVKEWKKSYTPCILPIHLRNHRRLSTFNPHFWDFPKTKQKAKQALYVRLGIIELSLQNGLGSRYRLVPPPNKSFDFPMKCIARVLLGSPCWVGRLREEACVAVVSDWERYKWDVKFGYSFNIDFFRDYNPESANPEDHERAKYLYKVAVFERMYECKRLELGVACELYETNFYCIEALRLETDRFRVIPSETEFNKSVYFFAKEIPYQGKMIDRDIDLYENFFLIWLNPVIRAGRNLIMQKCLMKITFHNTDIGYFHLFEEDPYDPIDDFNVSNNFKRPRNHFVEFFKTVYVLHYYQRTPCRLWKPVMEGIGVWEENEVDDRILLYNPLMIDRYHRLEKEFLRITEISFEGFPVSDKQTKKHSRQIEAFLSHLKSLTDKEVKNPPYNAKKIRKMYINKEKRKQRMRVALSQKVKRDNPHKYRDKR